jgi:hypothetical protein
MSPLTTIQKVDFSKSEQYTLSIRINTDGFSFSIFNPIAENPSTLFKLSINPKQPLIANFKDKVTNYPFLSQLYKRVNIVIGDTKAIVHPTALFTSEIAEELYFYGQKVLSPNTKIVYNNIETSKLTVIYGINKGLYKFLNEHFRNPRFFSQTTPLLAYFAQRSKESATLKMFVQFQRDAIHIFCLNRGKLTLTNSFNTSEISNQVYYILYIWKQLNYEQQRDELYLSGALGDKEELIKQLEKYIQHLSIIDTPDFIDLKAINLCEL